MRVLLIGGTGFTGPAVVQQLLGRGHEVSLLHRGGTHDPRTAGAREIIADRTANGALDRAVAETEPDLVIDMIAFTAGDALATIEACRNRVDRAVVLSSIDVYLAYGRIWRTEPGPVQPTPLTEASELRETDQPEGPDRDKIAVERAFLDARELAATVLRLPAIYGPKDRYRRLRSYLKRMDDGREEIPLAESMAGWKFSRGYADNVAHAIVLAAEGRDAAGEVFNVSEPAAMTEFEFVQAIGRAAGWRGEVRILPDASLPEHLKPEVDFSQDWEADSSKIRRALGYTEIVPVSEAVLRTVRWERENPPDVEPTEFDYAAEDEALRRA